MITTRLFGGMGNQLFQSAMAISYAKRIECEFHIPDHTENDSIWPPTITHLTNKNFNPSLQTYLVQEQKHSFNEIPKYECQKMNVIFSGYWQSHKYLDDYRKEILLAFNIPWTLMENTCGVHIRRGDYLKYPTKHPVITKEYLDRAIYQIIDEGADMLIFFSDDMEWASDYAAMMPHKIRYTISTERDPIKDLSLLSSCNHQIISNSTFGWFGAWLNQAENKVVITPHEDVWFGPDNRHLDVSDLLPKSWHRIKY